MAFADLNHTMFADDQQVETLWREGRFSCEEIEDVSLLNVIESCTGL
jgi:hypothetical protein